MNIRRLTSTVVSEVKRHKTSCLSDNEVLWLTCFLRISRQALAVRGGRVALSKKLAISCHFEDVLCSR